MIPFNKYWVRGTNRENVNLFHSGSVGTELVPLAGFETCPYIPIQPASSLMEFDHFVKAQDHLFF